MSSELEDQFLNQCRGARLPTPQEQYRFHPDRGFLADFYFESAQLIVEVDGGGHHGGKHNRELGRTRDCERDALALLTGHTVLRLTSSMIKDGSGIKLVDRVIEYLLGVE